MGVDPARRDDSAVRRRHAVDQSRARVRDAVGAAARLRRRPARHSPLHAAGRRPRDRRLRRPLVTEHPLVRVHPETGERALYVSPSFLKSIVGLTPRESQALLELLWEHVTRPEFTIRFKWEPRSIAFWDNRATAHLAPVDIFDLDFDRQLYRTTLVGDVPVGPDGRPSVALEGSPVETAAAVALN
nr:TauD/TfdA family dioxygenase [Burkholderia pseudomultivorans]